MCNLAAHENIDLSQYLPYGKILDYPLPKKENITKNKRTISYKPSELFCVICNDEQCVDTCTKENINRFDQRMSYLRWIKEHHLVMHKGNRLSFIIASFWSTAYNSTALHTEYRLISLHNYDYLKPVNNKKSKKSNMSIKECGYCNTTKKKLNRCGGCKILCYCSTECQKKHWFLIHKSYCKKWKKQYKDVAPTPEQINELLTSEFLKLNKMSNHYYGKKVDEFTKMLKVRAIITQNEKPEELLFENKDDSSVFIANTMIMNILDAFDRDGDRKLNFKEWKSMANVLGFGHRFFTSSRIGSAKILFFNICIDIGLLNAYQPSISSGIYGSYIYENYDTELLLGPREIFETLKFFAWFRSRMKNNTDDDFKEKFDFYDEDACTEMACQLLFKLYGHAEAISFIGETHREDLFDAILETVPYLNNDIISIIYNYVTLTGQNVIYVSWHKIKWLNFEENQRSLWKLYDIKTDIMYYDICYLAKDDEQGYQDIEIMMEICDDKKSCDDKLDTIESYTFGHEMIDMKEKLNPRTRWNLGTCPSSVPNYSFSLKEHAILIGKVLKFHNLNPKLCHYIYVGIQIHVNRNDKSKIVDAFNEIYGSNTRFRSHTKKEPMMFHDMMNI
eukprot:321866_1